MIIIEVLVNLISPYPFFSGMKYKEFNPDYDYETIYDINDILLAFSFIRVYLFIRFILVVTMYASPRS
jgi:hypothetical protein